MGADVLKALEEDQMKEPTGLFWCWQTKFLLQKSYKLLKVTHFKPVSQSSEKAVQPHSIPSPSSAGRTNSQQ